MKKQFYFNQFESRRPYPAIATSSLRNSLFQTCAIITTVFGFAYLYWRWRYSLNPSAMVFSVTLVTAETLSFISTLLIIMNFWDNKDPQKKEPVHWLSDVEELQGRPDRPLKLDVFIASYNEDVELVRYSIMDAKQLRYAYADVKIRIYVLDDGRRDGRNPLKENMKQVCEEEGVGYLIREHNEGYKAGNLKNALEHTDGDIFAILDADTRPFPDFLMNTTGYFRNPKVAWVQTPQWFYDTTEPEKISDVLNRKMKLQTASKNLLSRSISHFSHFIFGRMTMNADIFGNDPRLFYDVILRKRNYWNAAFCCGAGSIHRREAIMSLAVRDFAEKLSELEIKLVFKGASEKQIKQSKRRMIIREALIPFKFHASEDIYTSIMLHADKKRKWESIQHAGVECKMLSTQDLDSWIKQHKRYAEGSLDIALKDNPLFMSGLSIGQRMMYFSTIWSYFAPLWILIFLLSPIVFFFTLTLPVQAYSFDFFKYFLPFQLMNTITIAIGCWGVDTKRGDQFYISSFWFMLMSLVSVIRGKKVSFNVTPKDRGSHTTNRKHIVPHLLIISLILLGITYNTLLLIVNRHPSPSGFAANSFWCLFNILSLSIMIRAAHWHSREENPIDTKEELKTAFEEYENNEFSKTEKQNVVGYEQL